MASAPPAAPAAPSRTKGATRGLALFALLIFFVAIPFGKVTGLGVPMLGIPGINAPNALPDYTITPPTDSSSGGTGGGSTNTAPSATPSPTTNPRNTFLMQAAALSQGQALQHDGFEPAAVYELAPGSSVPGNNGQISKWLTSITGKGGGDTAYVLFRDKDHLDIGVDKPTPGIKPDRVMLINSNSLMDGNVVAYAQDFEDGRGTVCAVNEVNKFDLSDPNNWYELNKLSLIRGNTTNANTSVLLTHQDLTLIPDGEEVSCWTYKPEDAELPVS